MWKAFVCIAALFLVISSNALPQEPTEDASNASAEALTSSAVISGVPMLKFGKGMDCTFFGALRACLQRIGEQVTYEYLMGVSGAAFATRFRSDWSATSADAGLNEDHAKPALEALGYSYEWAGSGMPNASEVVIASIDAGIPIVASRLVGYTDWGLLVGYKHGGDIWLCRTYHDKTDAYTEVANLPHSMLILGEKRTQPSTEESVKRSIRLSVQFAKGEKTLSDARFEVGLKAYEAWIKALNSQDLAKYPPAELQRIMHVNAWLYRCLIDARSAGVKYLKWAEKFIPDEARSALNDAATAYEEEVRMLEDARNSAPYPYEVSETEGWTSKMRNEQIKTMTSALEKEKEAIASLEKVLSVIDATSDSGHEN